MVLLTGSSSNSDIRVRTLIVDDSEKSLVAICNAVANNPNLEIIDTATNGYEALEKSRRWHPRLVLMDIQMPKMNGIAATEELKREFPDTLVILLSVHESPELRSLCRERGASAFVGKSQLPQQLAGVIEAVLANLQPRYPR